VGERRHVRPETPRLLPDAAIVTALFYALLAVVTGTLVVSFGVGGIPLARRYVEQWAGRAEQKVGEIRTSGSAEAARAEGGNPRVQSDRSPPPPPNTT
jgi:hypothetical protein